MKTIQIMFLLFILLGHILSNQAAILQCDFETLCNDFDVDSDWGLTDGLHPHSINHDHTLNTSSGHYLFYNPQTIPPFDQIKAEIKITDWLQLSADRAVCFRMWYYTPRLNLPFTIQLVQGDDEQLTRIIASISGKVPTINDWTLINVTLPAEKIKLSIRLNTSAVPLVFDDLSVDYCDSPRPAPPKILFACDFESSCKDNFISLPDYPYQWSIMEASDAIKTESEAPSVDFTFGNQSGHYALLTNSKITEKGNVGYLSLQKPFNLTSNESFCLNFQYYAYGRPYGGNLKVYAWMSDPSDTIQILWPQPYHEYIYNNDKWTWSIVNLPVGYYSLLFRVDNTDNIPRSFALDNIDITSCDYPPSTFANNGALLSFSCNFDNLTMCDMENGDRADNPTFNFTVVTGDTVPDRELGPLRDHTSNATLGGFIYWDRHFPFIRGDSGNIHPSKQVEQNVGMCIRFAYYVKSLAENKNGTVVSLWTGGCDSSSLWDRSLDDSQGWQVAVAPVPKKVCEMTFYFIAHQQLTIPVSVAFDDIEIGSCSSLSPTTTTTSTSTSTVTTMTTITSTSTRIITTSSSSTIQTTTTIASSTTSTSTLPTSTSTGSNARQLIFLMECNLIVICSLLRIIRQMF